MDIRTSFNLIIDDLLNSEEERQEEELRKVLEITLQGILILFLFICWL